jgi:hypothetical protein
MPYKIFCVQIDVDAYGLAGEKNIPDCISASLANSPQIEQIITAGQTMATHAVLVAQKVAGSFSTYAIAAAIDAIGLAPLPIDTDTEPGVKFFLQKFDNSGIVSSSGHRSLLISCGAVVPRRLSCDHQGHARMDIDVIVAKESGNNAVVISDAATIPTIASGWGNRWTLGPMKVGNIVLADYTGFEIDFGNQVTTRGSQSDTWDAYVEIMSHAPSITIRGINPAWFTESTGIGVDGVGCTHANTIMYLKKRDVDGQGFVADGTAEHISFTLKGPCAIETMFNAQAHMIGESSVRLAGLYDGTDNPIVVDTTAAIT